MSIRDSGQYFFLAYSACSTANQVSKWFKPKKKVAAWSHRGVSHIKPCLLNSKLFKIFLWGNEDRKLLMLTETRWVLRGRMLARSSGFQSDISVFIVKCPYHVWHRVTSILWLQKLAYLTVISTTWTSHCNENHLYIQTGTVGSF